MKNKLFFLILISSTLFFNSCSDLGPWMEVNGVRERNIMTKSFHQPGEEDLANRGRSNQESSEEAEDNQELDENGKPKDLSDLTNRWFFGQGLGETAANVGITAAFPPYAVYLIANAGLSFTEIGPVRISNALPETVRKPWNKIYDNVTSVPGRITAAVAREKYHGKFTK